MASRAGPSEGTMTVHRMAVDVELSEATRRLSGLGERFVSLVERIDAPDARAHGLEWTLAETAVHVWQGLVYYAACLRGEDRLSPREPGESFSDYSARENKAQIDAEPERDPVKIAGAIRGSLKDFVALATELGPDATATFAAGYSEDTTTSTCTFIGELVVHGYDIARAMSAPWEVDRATAALAVYATSAALPLALDERASAREDIHVEIRLRGGSPFSIRIREGRAWTEVTNESPDVRVSADPMAYLLVGYGRVHLLRPLLRGRILAWGRKPWVILKVPKMFQQP